MISYVFKTLHKVNLTVAIEQAMNQVNHTLNKSKWGVAKLKSYEETLYQVACILLAAMTTSVNFTVICSLLRQTRKRIDNSFLILSVSDFFVGLISFPIYSLQFSNLPERIMCQYLHPLISYFMAFTLVFSWLSTFSISLERYLVILQPNFHRKYLINVFAYLDKAALFGISALLGFYFFWTDYHKIRTKDLKLESQKISTRSLFVGVELIAFLAALFITIRTYMYVEKMDRKMKDSTSRKLAGTVLLISICLFVCNAPHFFVRFLEWIGLLDSPSLFAHVLHVTNLALFSNSFFNSLIILRSSKFKKKNKK